MINISKPTLVVNRDRCMANIKRMQAKATRNHVHFRPHFKTHQSAFIGNWFRKLGVHSITVSSISMAKYFAAYGWRDITIAFPVNLLEINLLSEFANDVELNIILDNTEVLPFLEGGLNVKIGVFIEVDTGDHRSGILWKDTALIDPILEHLSHSNILEFKGFLTHSGHTYRADSTKTILEIYEDTTRKMLYLKDLYKDDWPELILSVGDTPSCSLVDDLSEVDEIRPGNFAFYDLMQYSLGSCTMDDIAVAVACPVVGRNLQRNEIIIYGGAIHFSKEFMIRSTGERTFGNVVLFEDNGWTKPMGGSYLASLSQEHGIIVTTREIIEDIRVGDVLGVMPIHSCLTANLLKGYQSLDGENIPY
jgi:D-serine deaminase-like pyridoxal phosphate-dependent protein